jgi:hypothetical protein
MKKKEHKLNNCIVLVNGEHKMSRINSTNTQFLSKPKGISNQIVLALLPKLRTN